jgi:hypothetical protein
MFWIKHSLENDWFTQDRVYLIKVETYGCTLFFEGKSIGRYTNEISAKKAAERHEEIKKALSSKIVNHHFDPVENSDIHEIDRFWEDQNRFD